MTETERREWKDQAVKWLVSQGISTVLLMVQTTALCGATFYGLPWARACLKEDLTAINEAHKATVNNVILSFEKANERQNKIIDDLMQDRMRTRTQSGL